MFIKAFFLFFSWEECGFFPWKLNFCSIFLPCFAGRFSPLKHLEGVQLLQWWRALKCLQNSIRRAMLWVTYCVRIRIKHKSRDTSVAIWFWFLLWLNHLVLLLLMFVAVMTINQILQENHCVMYHESRKQAVSSQLLFPHRSSEDNMLAFYKYMITN